MKFAVTTEGEEPIKLSLVVSRSGHIADVEGTMPDGETFSILSFLEKGTIVLHSGLPADAGFQLTETDEHGVGRKIVIDEDLPRVSGIPSSPLEIIRRSMRATQLAPMEEAPDEVDAGMEDE